MTTFSPAAAEVDRDLMARREAPTGKPATGPTVEQLLQHARKFGVDSVWETARPHFSDNELTAFLAELKGIAAPHRKAKQPESWWAGLPSSYTPPGEVSLTSAQLEVKVMRDSGLSPAEISRKTGKSETTVSRLLAAAAKSQPLALAAHG